MKKLPPKMMKPKKKIKSIQDIRDAHKEIMEDPEEEMTESPMEEKAEQMPPKMKKGKV